MSYKLINGNSLTELKKLKDNSIDSVVTDPPYELGFMGKEWDKSGIAYNVELWKEVLRVLKPGGHMLAFSGTRTYHRMVCAIENAGFQIRDQISWVYSSGFPKSQNVGKKVKGYDGWGTALKPAQEPIVLARKPLSEDTIAKNVIKHGTGAIDIDGCRVATKDKFGGGAKGSSGFAQGYTDEGWVSGNEKGRWPANFIHDGSDEVLELFPNNIKGGTWTKTKGMRAFNNAGKDTEAEITGNDNSVGSAARFFYCPKANKKDRNEGMPLPADKVLSRPRREDGSVIYKETDPEEWAEAMSKLSRKDKTAIAAAEEKLQDNNNGQKNNHPTVKPIELMKYLCKMITPKNGTILDPFMGSGSTGKAAMLLGYNFIGIDLTPEYITISKNRIKAAEAEYNKQNSNNKYFED